MEPFLEAGRDVLVNTREQAISPQETQSSPGARGSGDSAPGAQGKTGQVKRDKGKETGNLEDDLGDEEMCVPCLEQEEAIGSLGLKTLYQPTREEIIDHERTHLPFRDWCPYCLQGKGVSAAYKKRKQTG